MRHGLLWGLATVVALGAAIVLFSVMLPEPPGDRTSPVEQNPPQEGERSILDVLEARRKEAVEAAEVAVEEGQAALDLPKLAKEARPAVMILLVYDKDGEKIGTGTGFVISPDGRLVTNDHVVEKAAKVIAKAENGGLFPVEGVLARDVKADLALLKLEGKDLPWLKLGSADKIEVGTRIAVIGSPLGLEGTLSEGIVSAIRDLETLGVKRLQITAAVSPGSSGSPVLNEKGEVVGVAVAIIRQGQSLNFAVPVEAVKKLVTEAGKTGKVKDFGKQPVSGEEEFFADPYFRAVAEADTAKDYVMMLKAAKELVKRYPDHEVSHHCLGEAYSGLRFWDAAIAAYKQAIKLKPDEAYAWYSLGLTYTKAKQYNEAIVAYKQAIKVKPDYAKAWYNLGCTYDEVKQYNAAIAAYKQAIKIKPDLAEAWNNLGITYAKAGQYNAAIAAHKQAIKIKPDYAEAWNNLGITYSKAGQYNAAIAAHKQAIKIKPDYADAWNTLVIAYFLDGQKENAMRALRELRKLDPAEAAELEKLIRG